MFSDAAGITMHFAGITLHCIKFLVKLLKPFIYVQKVKLDEDIGKI